MCSIKSKYNKGTERKPGELAGICEFLYIVQTEVGFPGRPQTVSVTSRFVSHGRQPECFLFSRGFAPYHGQEKLLDCGLTLQTR